MAKLEGRGRALVSPKGIDQPRLHQDNEAQHRAYDHCLQAFTAALGMGNKGTTWQHREATCLAAKYSSLNNTARGSFCDAFKKEERRKTPSSPSFRPEPPHWPEVCLTYHAPCRASDTKQRRRGLLRQSKGFPRDTPRGNAGCRCNEAPPSGDEGTAASQPSQGDLALRG